MAKARVRLNEGMQFVGCSDSGHGMLLDTDSQFGGSDSAARPVETVLIAAGGCSGMDVISILRKMKQDVRDFEVELEAKRSSEHPKVLTEIDLHYKVWGEVEESKFVKAIELSIDKYCSVLNMLKPTVNVEYTYEIDD